MSFKPCPFCGNEEIVMRIEQRASHAKTHMYATCTNCRSKGALTSITRPLDNEGNHRRFTPEEVEVLKRNEDVIEACEKQWNRRDG